MLSSPLIGFSGITKQTTQKEIDVQLTPDNSNPR